MHRHHSKRRGKRYVAGRTAALLVVLMTPSAAPAELKYLSLLQFTQPLLWLRRDATGKTARANVLLPRCHELTVWSVRLAHFVGGCGLGGYGLFLL